MKVLLIPSALLLLSACSNNKKNEKGKEGMPPDTTTAAVRDEVSDPFTDVAERSITGSWRPVAMNIQDMAEEEKKEMIANIRLEFTGDGKFAGFNKEKKQEGTYTYSAKDQLLTILNTARGDKPEKFSIGWEDDLLLMTNKDGTVKLKKE